MGNTIHNINESLNKEYEYKTGKKLIRALYANSREQLEECVDVARKELRDQDLKIAHDQEYNNMVREMTTYLTKKYDLGEGMRYGKTPMELAESLKANYAIEFLNETLYQLSKNKASQPILNTTNTTVRDSLTVGKVDKTRAIEARERLKAYQKEYNANKK